MTSKAELDRKIDALLGEMRDQNRRLDEATSDKKKDGGRKAEALDGQVDLAKKLTAVDDDKFDKNLKAALKAQREEYDAKFDELKAALHLDRSPSKAALIGQGRARSASRVKSNANGKPHPFLKAAFRDYEPGEFISAYSAYKGYLTDGLDVEVITAGKNKLAEFASWIGAPDRSSALLIVSDGKATLGTTGATGGFVLPNNLVDSVVKPNVQKAVYQSLVTVVNGVAVRGVDQPYRLGTPPRATFQDWGVAKTNLNESYGSYSATLGTLAVIYDASKQYLRFSAGSAEQDIMDEITKGMILGENYEIIAGAGTGSVGSGDPVNGIYTVLNGLSSFDTAKEAFSSASNSTQVGSFAEMLTVAGGFLAGRNRESEAYVVDSTTFWTSIGQGTDYAGFWLSPTGGPSGFTRTASGALSFWGVPVLYDSNLGANATTKIAIGGEWSAVKLYRGLEFRIDSSDVAGNRWDNNLVGFRGEEEIGLNAGTAVHTGALQLMTAVIA